MMKKEQSSSKPGPAHIIACDILCIIVRINVKVGVTESELCIPFPEAYSVLRLYR